MFSQDLVMQTSLIFLNINSNWFAVSCRASKRIACYPSKRRAWKLACGQAQSAEIKVVIGLKHLALQI